MSWYSSHEKDNDGNLITAIYMADMEIILGSQSQIVVKEMGFSGVNKPFAADFVESSLERSRCSIAENSSVSFLPVRWRFL